MIYPSFEQFCRWSRRYSIIPFWYSFNSRENDCYSSFLSVASNFEQTFLLDSSGVSRSTPNARYSFFPLTASQNQFIVNHQKYFSQTWKEVQDYFKVWYGPQLSFGLPPFYGGASGILSYDSGRFFERGWKTASPPDKLKVPLLNLGIFDEILCFDHKTKKITIFSCLRIKKKVEGNLKNIYENKKNKLLKLVAQLGPSFLRRQESVWNVSSKRQCLDSPFHGNDTIKDVLLSNEKWFVKSVQKIKEYIAAGDIYQVNLSQRIELNFNGTALNFFENLRNINPSPYSCFFRFPNHAIVSCSPELLLKKRGTILKTRPIAGTRPRGQDSIRDRQLEGELLLSGKERAEHIMLLDLERNDLGKVCESGKVKVKEKMIVEKYSHVMHIVSSVEGKIKDGETIFSALESVFPGGTITGCPKVRCMEILDELEPVARGPFFGSAGWIGYQGDGEFNLLIRTAVLKDCELRIANSESKKNKSEIKRKVSIQVGSGIVADSSPELEYQESLHKAQALLEACSAGGR